ncbi:MAG: hypothetical protein WAO37_10970 [Thermacetogeniaceae bacterium]
MVDTDYYIPSKKCHTFLFCILTVALLTTVKGIDILLKAFAQAFASKENVSLEIREMGHKEKNWKT